MPPTIDPSFALPALAGIALGLWLLVRGMRGYLVAGRISGTSTSSIESIALGEVLVSGSIEPAEPQERSGRSERTILREERSVGFRIRGRTGSLRVLPRSARGRPPALRCPERLRGRCAARPPTPLRTRTRARRSASGVSPARRAGAARRGPRRSR